MRRLTGKYGVRTIFRVESKPGTYCELLAAGDLTEESLEGLSNFIALQQKRLCDEKASSQ